MFISFLNYAFRKYQTRKPLFCLRNLRIWEFQHSGFLFGWSLLQFVFPCVFSVYFYLFLWWVMSVLQLSCLQSVEVKFVMWDSIVIKMDHFPNFLSSG